MIDYAALDTATLIEFKKLYENRHWCASHALYGWNSLDGTFKWDGDSDSFVMRELDEIRPKLRAVNTILMSRKDYYGNSRL